MKSITCRLLSDSASPGAPQKDRKNEDVEIDVPRQHMSSHGMSKISSPLFAARAVSIPRRGTMSPLMKVDPRSPWRGPTNGTCGGPFI